MTHEYHHPLGLLPRRRPLRIAERRSPWLRSQEALHGLDGLTGLENLSGQAGGLTGEDLVALHAMTVNQDEAMGSQQQPLDHMHEVCFSLPYLLPLRLPTSSLRFVG